MERLIFYRNLIKKHIDIFFKDLDTLTPQLYEPIKYALDGGKKVRPASLLMTVEAFGKDYKKAIPVAIAVEMFHNFTLIHDDIMDNSPLRRGRPTVFKKWSVNQAILSGDTLLILVYKLLSNLEPPKFYKIYNLFNDTAIAVCEGQQLDMDFEKKQYVSLDDYLFMIEKKTATLLASSLAIGAIIADANDTQIQNIYNFGLNLGMSFQIQDDYFDLYADEKFFGKKIGTDVLDKKKTFLYVAAIENSDALIRAEIQNAFEKLDGQQRITQIKSIYNMLNVNQVAKQEIDSYFNKALEYLNNIELSSEGKKLMGQYAYYILKRNY